MRIWRKFALKKLTLIGTLSGFWLLEFIGEKKTLLHNLK